jgi:hypothetical protein
MRNSDDNMNVTSRMVIPPDRPGTRPRLQQWIAFGSLFAPDYCRLHAANGAGAARAVQTRSRCAGEVKAKMGGEEKYGSRGLFRSRKVRYPETWEPNIMWAYFIYE